jgi:hypothetical protein
MLQKDQVFIVGEQKSLSQSEFIELNIVTYF